MKILYGVALLSCVTLQAHAQTVACSDRESNLKAAIRDAKACGPKHQRCLDMGPTNPMRELNYCQNLLDKCESLDGPIDNEKLKLEVQAFKNECS